MGLAFIAGLEEIGDMAMIRDYTEGFELPGEFLKKHTNELNCLNGLWAGLSFLADSVGKYENEETGPDVTIVIGNAPPLQNAPILIIACCFHWYSVSACNLVRLIGWLHEQLSTTAPVHDDYVKRVLPEVLTFRNKVAAHFARISERDTSAEQLASVFFNPYFKNGVFYATPWTVRHSKGGKVSSSESLKPWSLTKVHAALEERYRPQMMNDSTADSHDSGRSTLTGKVRAKSHVHGDTEVWNTYSFAPKWYKDALEAARSEDGLNARRREIVFAVCTVESYLLEWARDDVIKGGFSQVEKYFPRKPNLGIKDRWKKTLKKLETDDLIPAAPDFKISSAWGEFRLLVDRRDDVVHANVSRPTIKGGDKNSSAEAKLLDGIEQGWPCRTVYNLITELHEAVEGQVPDWLVLPGEAPRPPA